MKEQATYRSGNISKPRAVEVSVLGPKLSIKDSKGKELIDTHLSAVSEVKLKSGIVVFRFDGKLHSLEFISVKKKVLYSMFGLLGIALMMLFNQDIKQKSQTCYDSLLQGGAAAK